jgi:hypothetical protein
MNAWQARRTHCQWQPIRQGEDHETYAQAHRRYCPGRISHPAARRHIGSQARPATTSVPACGTSLETWFAPDGDGFAGGASYVVEFSNIGKATCTIRGYPTVKLPENGTQAGLRATTFGAAPATVTLKQGQTVHVALIIRDASAICKPVPANGLRVQPPGKTQARDFRLTAFGARRGKSTMSVDAVNPGIGIPHFTTRWAHSIQPRWH